MKSRLTLFALAYLLLGCSQEQAHQDKTSVPAAYVDAAKPTLYQYQPSIESIGTLYARQHATLSIENAGIVEKIHFQSGQTIQMGSPLLELNSELEQAKLVAEKSRLTEAKHTLKRLEQLRKSHSISDAEFEKAKTNATSAAAAVQLLQTQIAHKSLKAPFSGKLGFKKVEQGEYLTPGQHIVKLSSLNPMKIQFSVPEQFLPELREKQKITFKTDAYPKQTFEAKINAIDVETTAESHLIHIEGLVNNNKALLYPGLFAKLNLFYGTTHAVLTVPKTAINYNMYGNSIYKVVCKADKQCMAKEVFVQLGPDVDDRVIVQSGIHAEDDVIISGQLKVHHQAPVIINHETSEDHPPQTNRLALTTE